MQKLINLFLITAAISFLQISCGKTYDDTIKDEATVLYEGDPAVDGCGYFLLIKNAKHKPVNLEQGFSEDGLEVSVEYKILNEKWKCNWQETEYLQIKIINISKK